MPNERLYRGYQLLEKRGLAEQVVDGYQLTPKWLKLFPLYISAAQARGLSFEDAAEEGTKDTLQSEGSASKEDLEYMIEATIYLSRHLRARFR